MTTAVLSYARVQKNIRSKIHSIDLPELNWKVISTMAFCAALGLLVFYVLQVNDLTKGYYQINSFDRQIIKLSHENSDLQGSFAENSFLGQTLSKIQALNFQKATSVKYIQILNSSAEAVQKNKNI